MPKTYGMKLKMLTLLHIFQTKTDADHPIKTVDILSMLEEDGVHCDRKTLYTDVEALRECGYDIETVAPRNGGGFFMRSRDFEIAELKLLVDAVLSSKFITEKKSKELIAKIGKLTSEHEAKSLNRQMTVSGRVKSDNESILYNVDFIHRAMREGVQIEFKYLNWNLDKKLVEREPGKLRKASPWSLIWFDSNYYLLAYDSIHKEFRHFRVDKMSGVSLLKKKRDGFDEFQKIDMSKYSDEMFGMFHDKDTETVALEFSNGLVGVILDRFGTGITLRRETETTTVARVNVSVSQHFYSWIAAVCSGNGFVRIKSPTNIKNEYEEFLKSALTKQTEGNN